TKVFLTREEVLASNCSLRKDWFAGSSAYVMISQPYALTAEALVGDAVNGVNELANALPTAENLEMLDGENLYKAYNAYVALDATAKDYYNQKVTAGEFVDIVALKTAYEKNWVMVYNPTSAWVNGIDYRNFSEWDSFSAIATGTTTTDATYGTVTAVTVATGTSGRGSVDTNGAMQISMDELVAAFNANPTATAVKFYYKATPENWGLTGKATESKPTVIATGKTGGAWGEKTLTRAQIINGSGEALSTGIIGDTNIAGRGETFYFSNFYLIIPAVPGENADARAVNDLAKALHTAENLVMLDGENVYNVYNQYVALGDEAKTAYDEAVTSGDYIDISALKAAYETKWVMVYNPTSAWVNGIDYRNFSEWDSFSAIATGTTTTDATYGTVTAVTVATGTSGRGSVDTNGAMQISMDELVAAFNANPTATAVKFYYKATPENWGLTGKATESKPTVIATGKTGGAWGEKTLTRAQIINGSGEALSTGIIGDTNIAGRGETFYFSNFYLVK
ncbi:MAG: hypothetical protein MJ066_03415, partial [Clostridia bacterium]|nr:hypothetical protein [Clostridia bacterium]